MQAETNNMFEESVITSPIYKKSTQKYALDNNQQTLTTKEKKINHIAEVMKNVTQRQETIGQTLQQMDLFWLQVSSQTRDIHDIANSMRQKAQQGQ